jgi:uncharacterized membrane protein
MRIDPNVSEWLNLLARWAHVFAGILWVGSTYYFTWLDGRFTEQEKQGGEGGEVWMVHSGGFYVVKKRKGLELDRHLHWFRWEAAFTWLTGFFLLVLLYYMGGGLVEPDVRDRFVECYNETAGGSLKNVFNVSAHYDTFAVVFGVGTLVLGWLVYDLVLHPLLGRNEKLFAVVAFALIVALSYALTGVLSGRAAYIHLGALLGTIMVANVWQRILPAQRKMIAALKEGKPADERLAASAKFRSKQNTFMAVPVVFTMISNHYPVATYGHEHNWLILPALVLAGWAAAYFIRRA